MLPKTAAISVSSETRQRIAHQLATTTKPAQKRTKAPLTATFGRQDPPSSAPSHLRDTEGPRY